MGESNFVIELDESTLNSLSNDINDLFAEQVGADVAMEEQLLHVINNYLTKLNTLQTEVFTLRDKVLIQQNSTLNKIAAALRTKKGENASQKQQVYAEFSEVFEKMKQMFIIGYRLVNKIRRYITNQEIKYHIAIERGKSKDSIIYTATEQHIVENLNLDVYRFAQALFSAEAQELDYNARYTAAVKRSNKKDQTEIIAAKLPKKGTTLWSKGYRVFLVAKSYKQANFGHFLETYYYFGGNKQNRRVRNFNSIKFYQYMIALQNSTPFYQSGDFEDIQLKSNTATITNIKTIKDILIKIQQVLINEKGAKKKQIKSLLTTKKYTKQQMALKASAIEVPKEIEQAIYNMVNK